MSLPLNTNCSKNPANGTVSLERLIKQPSLLTTIQACLTGKKINKKLLIRVFFPTTGQEKWIRIHLAENFWPLLWVATKRSKCGLGKWSMFLTKDRNRKQWMVQRGSVTLHVNDRSAAGSAGSLPHRYAFVCSGSKATPTHWDRPALTE